MEQEFRSMRSISAVLAPPQDVGGRWEPPERLPSDISSWSRVHGESGVVDSPIPTHLCALGRHCVKLKFFFFL